MAQQSITVNAKTRTEFGKNASRRLRRNGIIPGTVYGRGEAAISLSLDPKVIMAILHSHSGQNTIFELSVDGQSPSHTLIKDYQRDPVKGHLLHLDLVHIDMTQKLIVRVPIEVVGVP